MAKVVGIGGVFFQAKNPQKLADWYRTTLLMPIEDGDCNAGYSSARFLPQTMSANSYTVWATFSSETDYFQPSTNPYMINLIVDVLDEALAQVKDGGKLD